MKNILSALLVLLLLLAAAPCVLAADSAAQESADALHELGLFNGTGSNADGTPDYDLDRALTRHEAVTMLVRMLGKEEAAKDGSWTIPFTDVADWAVPYVGYAYKNGLTKGVSDTAFGGDSPVSAAQYITFVLRALGYDSSRDFQWDRAWELSDEIGLTSGRYNEDNSASFLRGDAAIVSCNALSVERKDTGKTLFVQLKTDGALPAHLSAPVTRSSVAYHSVQAIRERGVLRVAASDRDSWWMFDVPENASKFGSAAGTTAGAGWWLLQQLTEDLGVELEFVWCANSSGVLAAVERGDADMSEICFALSEERLARFSTGGDVHPAGWSSSSEFLILLRTASVGDPETVVTKRADLKQARIAVVADSPSASATRSAFPDAELIECPSSEEALSLMLEGGADAAVRQFITLEFNALVELGIREGRLQEEAFSLDGEEVGSGSLVMMDNDSLAEYLSGQIARYKRSSKMAEWFNEGNRLWEMME